MRKHHPSSTSSVFGITALCGILTVQIAWAADTWMLGTPSANSARTKTANVSGGGMTSAPDSSTAVFSWWVPDPSLPGGVLIEQQTTVTANLMAWSGNLAPNPTWRVSPKDGSGTYIGDHNANISWGTPVTEDGTSGHIVTEN
jgi:hypothetical protein